MDDPANLTKAQLLFWAGQTLDPGVPLYNMAVNIAIDGDVDGERFERALRKVVNACDALRSVFDQDTAMPQRRVIDDMPWTLERIDLSCEPDPDQSALDWAETRCQRVFKLDERLFDAALIKVGPNRHVWYLNQHHLVTDAWSTSVLFRQVASAYLDESFVPNLPAFGDYVHFEQEARQSPAGEAVVAHWKAKAARAASPPRLYGNPSRGGSTRTRRVRIAFGIERSERLRALAMEEDVRCLTPHLTFFNLFATLLFAYLYRVSGQRELALGTPAHNRPTLQFKQTVGVFIELYPLFSQVAEAETFHSLLDKVRGETAEFLRFARPGASDPEFNRCFNAVLNYINASFGEFAGMATRTDWIHCGHGDRGHAIRVQVFDFDATGNFVLEFDLDTAAFDDTCRARMPGHFLKLVDAFLGDRHAAIGSIDLLDAGERCELLDDFNESAAKSPLPDGTVVAMFEAAAAAFPDRIALVHGGDTMSFGELNLRACAWASTLDVEGQCVGVCMRRSPEWIVAVLAILKAGGAFVPLEPTLPPSRLSAMIADSGMQCLFASGESAALLAGIPAAVAIIAIDSGAPPGRERALPGRAALDGIAYMIYTSGSTGEPKGVPVAHHGLADYVSWATREYVRGDRLTFPWFTSPGFDLTLTSLFLPLTTAGTLVIYKETSDSADAAVIDVIRDDAVDFIKLTPAHLSLLCQVEPASSSRISRMVVGGEDLKTALARKALARFGDQVEIYNEYGPTEAVVGCMLHRFDPLTDTRVSVPIGRPAAHVQIYVLDEALAPVPEGVPGELCISRHGLTSGYHGQPELTAARFVPHPFLPGERLYRTGDLVRFHRQGSLEYLGRKDRQLKVSGIRVEAGEIEAAIESHPAVETCVVVARTRSKAPPPVATSIDYCIRCAIPSNYPEVRFDASGVCHICRDFERYREAAQAYFKPMSELEEIFAAARVRDQAGHDCIALLSGGKDSTYALYQLVGMGLKVHGFTLDNGYLSHQAMANIRRVVDDLQIDHEFATTPAMPEIFRDSLERFSNVCNNCFKTVYTLSVNRARTLGIPVIVTGLSRGQFFETRLAPDFFRDGRFRAEDIDAAVLEARKVYHRADDAVNRCLDVRAFADDAVFDQVRFVDFYRYCDVGMGDMLAFLAAHSPWQRPTDTGRSTNCRINDAGIYIHTRERGFHNYALPYSWDVRLGHKTRDEAIRELNDEIDTGAVQAMLAEIGYDESRLEDPGAVVLAAYYTGAADVDVAALQQHIAARLPAALIPSAFVRLEQLPLTPNGKIDLRALPDSHAADLQQVEEVPLEGEVEAQIAEIWSQVLKVPVGGAETSFFALGGASLPAMEVMLHVCRQFGISVPLSALFQRPTVRQLAALVEETVLAEIEALPEEEAARMLKNG